jgi:hypothetical protein
VNTLVVIGYQNKGSTSNTAYATGATDSAGNSYSSIMMPAPSGVTQGRAVLLYSRLTNPVTSGTVITFATTGTQNALYFGHAIGADGLLDYSANVQDNATSSTSPYEAPSLTVATGNNTGLLYGLFAYPYSNNFGANTPRQPPSPSFYAGFADGGSTSETSLGLAYRAVSSTGVNIGPAITNQNSSGALYTAITAHFTETPILYAQSNVIEMF